MSVDLVQNECRHLLDIVDTACIHEVDNTQDLSAGLCRCVCGVCPVVSLCVIVRVPKTRSFAVVMEVAQRQLWEWKRLYEMTVLKRIVDNHACSLLTQSYKCRVYVAKVPAHQARMPQRFELTLGEVICIVVCTVFHVSQANDVADQRFFWLPVECGDQNVSLGRVFNSGKVTSEIHDWREALGRRDDATDFPAVPMTFVVNFGNNFW